MVASEFIEYLNKFNFIQKSGLYDIVDRCVYILTFMIILLCTAIITVKSYVLDPMSCYVASDVSGANSMSYINNYCWITGTYSKAVHEHDTDDDAYWDSIRHLKINYYQWVPLVLGLQAAIIYLPFVFWEALIYNRMGTNLQFFIDSAKRCCLDFGESRQQKVKNLVANINVLLKSRITRLTGKRYTMKKWEITLFYLGLKCFTLLVIIAQFFIIENFLNLTGRYRFLGVSLLKDFVVSGKSWRENKMFPRMGFCRVPFKLQSTKFVNILAQCSLSVNMLNEKIFMFLWFWFTIIFAVQFLSIILWSQRLFWVNQRKYFLLRIQQVISNSSGSVISNDKQIDRPSVVTNLIDRHLLNVDGCFLLHMIKLNCGDLILNEIVKELIQTFKEDYTNNSSKYCDYDNKDSCSFLTDDDSSIKKSNMEFL